MSGSTTAAVVIPIVAFILLFSWIAAVFWADSNPRWGNSEPGSWKASSRTAVLPEGSSIPRPRAEAEGAPQQPAPQGQPERARR